MKKVIIIILTLSMLVFINYVQADVISDINKQLNDIAAEKKAAAARIAGVDQELSNYLYEIIILDDKIDLFSSKLEELQTKVDEINTKLSTQEKALQNSAQSYNSAEEVYITRLKVIYENGIPSMIDIFLSSENISDFFSKVNVLNSILEYDKSLVNNMQSQKEYIDFIKKDIEIQKIQLEQLKYDTEKSNEALSDAKSAKERKASELQSSKVSLKAKVEALAKAEEEASKKLREELAKIANSTSMFRGVFAWPVPGFSYVSANYGLYDPWNTGVMIRHSGVDIAGSGISGKPIVAAEDGAVIVATASGYGYGNHVVIDHGKSLNDGAQYRTLYGHMTSFTVTPGQTVVKGQTIGYVGSTGNSTGAHLHFEVIKNGSNVDPIGYIK